MILFFILFIFDKKNALSPESFCQKKPLSSPSQHKKMPWDKQGLSLEPCHDTGRLQLLDNWLQKLNTQVYLLKNNRKKTEEATLRQVKSNLPQIDKSIYKKITAFEASIDNHRKSLEEEQKKLDQESTLNLSQRLTQEQETLAHLRLRLQNAEAACHAAKKADAHQKARQNLIKSQWDFQEQENTLLRMKESLKALEKKQASIKTQMDYYKEQIELKQRQIQNLRDSLKKTAQSFWQEKEACVKKSGAATPFDTIDAFIALYMRRLIEHYDRLIPEKDHPKGHSVYRRRRDTCKMLLEKRPKSAGSYPFSLMDDLYEDDPTLAVLHPNTHRPFS